MYSFNNQFIRALLIVLMGFLIPQSLARATESASEPLAVFEVAIQDVNTRLDEYLESKQAIALIQTSEDKKGKVFQQEFIPKNTKQKQFGGKWKILREDKAFDQSINISNDILLETKNLDIQSAQLVAETNSTLVFRISNLVNVESDDGNEISNTDRIKLDDAIATNLLTEVIIDKQHSKIRGLKIYATTSFKPSFMVTIEKLELRLDFDEAWPGGPFIRKNMTKHIVGDLGWFVDINELVTTKLSNIRKVDLTKIEFKQDVNL